MESTRALLLRTLRIRHPLAAHWTVRTGIVWTYQVTEQAFSSKQMQVGPQLSAQRPSGPPILWEAVLCGAEEVWDAEEVELCEAEAGVVFPAGLVVEERTEEVEDVTVSGWAPLLRERAEMPTPTPTPTPMPMTNATAASVRKKIHLFRPHIFSSLFSAPVSCSDPPRSPFQVDSLCVNVWGDQGPASVWS